MEILKILIGLLGVGLAWALLYRTGLIYRINDLLRQYVFNDQVVLFSRRRIAILLLVLGGLSLFSGVSEFFGEEKTSPIVTKILLESAENEFRQKNFSRTIAICQEINRLDKENVESRLLLTHAFWGVGEKERAELMAKVVGSMLNATPEQKEKAKKFINLAAE